MGLIQAPDNGAAKVEQALIIGDLSTLSDGERVVYYERLCSSLGLNPLSKPFDYLKLNGRLVLYAKRDATDQLRKLHGVSITRLERERQDDVYCVTAYATAKDGRTDSSIGAVAIGNLRGEALANALMKAETKSKRRVTLSICGLGLLDETEIETVPHAAVRPAELPPVRETTVHDAAPEVCAPPPRPAISAPAEEPDVTRRLAEAAGFTVTAVDPDEALTVRPVPSARISRFSGDANQRGAEFLAWAEREVSMTLLDVKALLGLNVKEYLVALGLTLEQLASALWGFVHNGEPIQKYTANGFVLVYPEGKDPTALDLHTADEDEA